MQDLVHSQLLHFKSLIGDGIVLHGPAIKRKTAAAQAIGMAIHELVINDATYGALSTPDGRIHVSWSGAPEDSSGQQSVEVD